MALHKTPDPIEAFEAFVDLPENADRLFEFIGGEIVEVPSNPFSSFIASMFLAAIMTFVRENKLGYVTGEAGGYMVSGERYAPDVGFISRARQSELPQTGYNPNPPDLAVEVVSPSDKYKHKQLLVKISNYLAAGTVVWVAYPDEQQVIVHETGKPVRIYNVDDTLHGGDVLPGFTLPLRDIFETK